VTLASIEQLLRESGGKRLDPSVHVFELSMGYWPPFGRARRLHDKQARLLDAVRGLPWSVYLRSGEDPKLAEAPGQWVPVAKSTWIVPEEPSSLRLLDSILVYGVWQLYLGADALDAGDLPDLFEASPWEAIEGLRSHAAPLLIDAWHDNVTWRVALDPAAVPGLAAA